MLLLLLFFAYTDAVVAAYLAKGVEQFQKRQRKDCLESKIYQKIVGMLFYLIYKWEHELENISQQWRLHKYATIYAEKRIGSGWYMINYIFLWYILMEFRSLILNEQHKIISVKYEQIVFCVCFT